MQDVFDAGGTEIILNVDEPALKFKVFGNANQLQRDSFGISFTPKQLLTLPLAFSPFRDEGAQDLGQAVFQRFELNLKSLYTVLIDKAF